jgi:hypothetical protein
MSDEKPRIDEGAGHEITTWRARPFVIGVVSFFLFMALMFVILGALTRSWSHHAWPLRGPISGPQADARWNRTAPQLQANPDLDLQTLQKAEYERLHATRWTDQTHAYACIPIEQAMALVAQAAAEHRQILSAPKPATPIDLQNPKAGALAPRPSATAPSTPSAP